MFPIGKGDLKNKCMTGKADFVFDALAERNGVLRRIEYRQRVQNKENGLLSARKCSELVFVSCSKAMLLPGWWWW